MRLQEAYNPVDEIDVRSTGSLADREAQKALVAGDNMTVTQALQYTSSEVSAHHRGNPGNHIKSFLSSIKENIF